MKKDLFIILSIALITLSCSQPAAVPVPQEISNPTPAAPAETPSTTQGKSLTPYIVTFEASSYDIKAGDEVILNWEITNSTTASIDHGVGKINSKGTRIVTPKTTTTYILTATNSSGSSTTKIKVTVSGTVAESTPASFKMPEVLVFKAEPANIVMNAEQEVTLTWEVLNAYDVVIDPGFRIIRAKGTATVMPTFTTTYKLKATNDQGTILAATTVTVSGASLVEAPSIKFLTVDRYIIRKGETAVLSWKTVEASSVSIDKGVGTVDGEGTARVSPEETTLYTMTATNPRGAQFQTIVVNVK